MQSHNVPTIPGYQGDDQSETTIKAKAIEIGFPVLLKASAGGGGKVCVSFDKKTNWIKPSTKQNPKH
jgi:acetyl/propionyl-CoA carboxylase alpha subunit